MNLSHLEVLVAIIDSGSLTEAADRVGLTQSAETLLDATQHHWAIENSFHWVLDVTFREDHARNRLGDSPANMAVLRTIALNLLKQDLSKHSLKQKRFNAAMNNDFLFKLLTQIWSDCPARIRL